MKKHKKFAGIILAAGYSSRMQGLKAVLPFGEKTVIERQIQCFSDAGICDTFVVVGYRAESIAEIIRGAPVKIVVNEEYEKGMFSSVKAGIRAITAGDFEAVFMSPVDYPLIQPYTLIAMCEIYGACKPEVVYPCYKGKKGHPPLFSARLFEHILSARGEGGLKQVLSGYDAESAVMGNPSCLMDIDTKEDYEKALSYFKNHTAPDDAECEYIYINFDVPKEIIAHSRKVAGVATYLAAELNKKDYGLDPEVIHAGGLLHDIAKGSVNHAHKGADILKSMGYTRVASCIENHMDIEEYYAGRICEQSVLYLADKLTKDDRLVSLDERIAITAGEQYADKALLKLNTAKYIKENIERAAGLDFGRILSSETF